MSYYSPSGSFPGFFARFRLWVYRKQPRILLPILILLALRWRKKDKKKHPQYYRPHGLFVFSGLYGSGKTISMVREVELLMRKRPDMVLYSNFDIPHLKSKLLTSTSQIEQVYNEAGTIFCIDEAQLSFNARDYQNFPWEMVSAITQNRKEAKVMFFSAQNFFHVDKQIRDLCFRIIHCNSWLGIYFKNKWYTPDGYDKVYNPDALKRPRPLKVSRFVGYQELYDSFSTFSKMVKLEVSEDFGRRRRS